MKKYKLYLLLAALVGLTASCSRDAEESDLQTTDNSTVRIGASIDSGIRTRAGETYTIPDGYELRYVLEVWSTGTNAAVVYRNEQTVTEIKGVDFNFKLEKAGNYQALLWADFIDKSASTSQVTENSVTYTHYADKFYYTRDNSYNLKKIGLSKDAYEINNEARDAFSKCMDIKKEAGAYTETFTLNRPFGQINIIEKNDGLIKNVKTIKLTYKVPETFDVSTGKPGEASFEVSPSTDIKPTPTDSRKANLAYDYIFAPATGQLTLGGIALEFEATDADITLPPFTIPANMPVERNRRTNISGSILEEQSSAVALSVSLSTGWETDEVEKDADDLVWNGQYPTSEAEAKEWLGPETSGANDAAAINHVFTITAARQLAAMHYLWKNDKIKLPGAIGKKDEYTDETEGDTYADASYNLAVDINLNEKPWRPLGYEAKSSGAYSGIFNGQGHTVYGMNVSGEWGRAGFIGICVGGTVKNLNVKGNIDVTYLDGDYGGITGNLWYGKIAFCSFQGSVCAKATRSSNRCNVGGITGVVVGGSSFSQVISSYSVLTKIEATGGSAANKGGVVGFLMNNTALKGCYWQELEGWDNTNPYGSTDGVNSTSNCGQFANAAAMDATAIATMNAAATDNDYQWQADPAGGYPVLVKKTQP